MTKEEKEAIFFELNCLEFNGSDDAALELINKYPFIGSFVFEANSISLSYIAAAGFLKSVKRLLELGSNPNFRDSNNSSVLYHAIAGGHIDVAKVLLEHGVSPNSERIILRAANCSHADHDGCVELVKLLVKHGARLNDLYAMFGDKKNARTALDFVSAGSPMHAFLRSIGAKTAKEVLAENPKAPISDE